MSYDGCALIKTLCLLYEDT